MALREKLLMQKIKKRERIKKEMNQKKNHSFNVTPETPPKGKLYECVLKNFELNIDSYRETIEWFCWKGKYVQEKEKCGATETTSR